MPFQGVDTHAGPLHAIFRCMQAVKSDIGKAPVCILVQQNASFPRCCENFLNICVSSKFLTLWKNSNWHVCKHTNKREVCAYVFAWLNLRSASNCTSVSVSFPQQCSEKQIMICMGQDIRFLLQNTCHQNKNKVCFLKGPELVERRLEISVVTGLLPTLWHCRLLLWDYYCSAFSDILRNSWPTSLLFVNWNGKCWGQTSRGSNVCLGLCCFRALKWVSLDANKSFLFKKKCLALSTKVSCVLVFGWNLLQKKGGQKLKPWQGVSCASHGSVSSEKASFDHEVCLSNQTNKQAESLLVRLTGAEVDVPSALSDFQERLSQTTAERSFIVPLDTNCPAIFAVRALPRQMRRQCWGITRNLRCLPICWGPSWSFHMCGENPHAGHFLRNVFFEKRCIVIFAEGHAKVVVRHLDICGV